MLKKHRKILVGIFFAVLVISSLLVLRTLRSPVIIRIPDPDSIRGYPFVIVFNPLRDPGPEAAAQTFLEKLRDGKCAEATLDFGQERSIRICQKQTEFPLQDWKLIDLQTEDGAIRLTYRHRSRNTDLSEKMAVFVGKAGSNWKVIGFDIVY